jgi:hypothetical protein
VVENEGRVAHEGGVTVLVRHERQAHSKRARDVSGSRPWRMCVTEPPQK